MMLTGKLILLVASAVFLDKVTGVCFCPIDCLNCYFYHYPDTPVYKPSACTDTEAAQECERANWEISDMQSSLGSLVTIFLEDAINDKNMTMMQTTYVRSLLSLALEDGKPEGDCSNGLLTDTPIRDALAKCFSPELLAQCALVRDTVDDYQHSISIKLEGFLGNETMMYSENMSFFDRSLELQLINGDRVVTHSTLKDFIDMVRFRTSIQTARIRCASYEATTIEIVEAGAYGLSSSTGLLLAFLSAAGVMWLF